MLPLHRAAFQKAIISHLPATCTTHFGKRLVSYDDPASGPITLHFKDGTTAECDVLVGADGIKSAVRHTLFSNLAKEGKISEEEATRTNPIWSGTVAYRALIPKEVLEAKAPGHRALTEDMLVSFFRVFLTVFIYLFVQISTAERTKYVHISKIELTLFTDPTLQHLIIFPISKGSKINVVAFCSDPSKEGTQYSEDPKDWVVDVPKEELLQQYKGWEQEVVDLLEVRYFTHISIDSLILTMHFSAQKSLPGGQSTWRIRRPHLYRVVWPFLVIL